MEAAGHRSHVLPMRAKNLVHTCIINHPANCRAVIWSTTSNTPPPPLATHTHIHIHTHARARAKKHLVLYSWINCNNTVFPAVTPPSSGTFLRKQTTRRHTTETVHAEMNALQYSLLHTIFSNPILSMHHFRFPSRCTLGLLPPGVLSSACWCLPTFRDTIKQPKKKIILDQ